jgi:type IV pilus assembly protein PilP
MNRIKAVAVSVLMVGLTACSSDRSFYDLDQFMQEVKARPKGKIEPLPEFKAYQAFTYGAASRRSPFEAPQSVKAALLEQQEESNVQPDTNRSRELLESFAVTDLKMVGTLKRAGESMLWALINDDVGGVHRVRVGQFMGKNHGKIVAIKEGRIDLVEIVPNGRGGWIERPRALSLEEQKL